MTTFIGKWLEEMSILISDSMCFAPLVAFIAGALTSFMPCAISTIPLVIAYVGGMARNNTKRAFSLSVMFSIGMAITFTTLGTMASLLGRLMQGTGSWWYVVLGVLMVLMALQTWEIIQIIPSSYALGKNTKRGYCGAILAGILAGLFSSPCATPVLVALLTVVAREGSMIWGIVLLLMYSLGYSILVIITGTFIGFAQKLSGNLKYGKVSMIIKVIMGIAMLIIGLYMFYLGI